MPQRFLRPGITTSDRWNAVSWEAQSFFIRILTLVDDFGRYDGRVPILHGHCFALRDDVTTQKTAGFRSELQAALLIDVYSVDGKDYLQVSKWQERTRSEKSKFPDKPENTESQDSAAYGSEPQGKGASLVLSHRPSSIVHAIASPTPPSPQWGNGSEKKTPESSESKKIAALYRRKSSTPWSPKEIKAVKSLLPFDTEELDLVCEYTQSQMEQGEGGVHRRDLLTFLNNYRGEVDRARVWKDKPRGNRTNGHRAETAQDARERKRAACFPENIQVPVVEFTNDDE